VQRLPAPAQFANRETIRGDGQRQQDQEPHHAYGDEGPLHDVLHHEAHFEEVDEDDPGEEMQHDVEEREQAEHPPQLDDLVPPGELAHRGYGQRGEEARQRPRAGLIGDVVAWIRGEIVEKEAADERRGWKQGRHEGGRLDERNRSQGRHRA
jgi:hypothetical protein